MRSRITIEVDFENGNTPVIQILQQQSDDVRDKLISLFLESLQHTSRWCKITYLGSHGQSNMELNSPIGQVHKWAIAPITCKELPEELSLLSATLNTITNNILPSSIK